MLNKTLILLIKYIPIMQMVCVILSNTCFYFDLFQKICHIAVFLIGNSIMATIFLYVCSCVFKFCSWHRLIIISNFIVIIISSIEILYEIPISNLEHMILCYVVYLISLLVILIIRFRNKRLCNYHSF